jgi:hypothetical protein
MHLAGDLHGCLQGGSRLQALRRDLVRRAIVERVSSSLKRGDGVYNLV